MAIKEVGQAATEVAFQDNPGQLKNAEGEAVLEVNNDQQIFLTNSAAVKVSTFIDDDTMGTAAATSLATSESIKAYVDTSVAASDLDISDGSSTIAIALASETLTIGGTSNEIETTAAGNSITVGLPSDVTIGNELTVTGATLCGSRVDIDDSGTGDRIGLLGAWGDVGGGTLPNAKDFVIKAETGLGVALSPNNGAPVAYAASGGNFGIGTTAPTEKLEVNGTIKVSGATTHGNRVEIREGATAHTSAQLAAWNDLGGGSVPPDGRDFVIKAGADLGISLAPGNGGSKVYVTKLGNVGIGTTAPAAKLHVDGAVTVNGLISGVTDPAAASDAATKNYVDTSVAASDLDISDGSSTIAIALASETLTIGGTSNEIETTAAGNSITVGLPSDVTIGNELTVTGAGEFGGDLSVAKSGAGDASVTISTTSGGDPTLFFASQANREGIIKFLEGGANSASIKYVHAGDVFKFIANSITTVCAQIGETASYFTSNLGLGGETNPQTPLDIGGDSLRIQTAKSPSSASDTGIKGQICWDNNYLYICTDTDTWKRVAHGTW